MIERRTISIVSTELQLMNAVEYIISTSPNGDISKCDNRLIIANYHSNREKHILTFLNSTAYRDIFSEVSFIRFRGVNLLGRLLASVKVIFKIFSYKLPHSIDDCILGLYYHFFDRLLFWRVQRRCGASCRLIVVDDGNATFGVLKDRASEKKTGKPSIWGNIVVNSLFKLCGEKSFIPEKAIFFSAYDINPTLPDELMSNSYSFLRNNIKDFPIPQDFRHIKIIFMGAPVYKARIMSAERLNYHLSEIKKYLHFDKCLYYSHPVEEDADWMDAANRESYQFVPHTFPIELLLGVVDESYCILSFFSSAMLTLKAINASPRYFGIDVSEDPSLGNLSIEALKATYSAYKEAGIELFKP